MTTLTTVHHAAALDPMTGYGVLALPDAEADVLDPFGDGVAGTVLFDYRRMVADIEAQGWVLDTEDDGTLVSAGRLPDGRHLVGLYGLDPVTSLPALEEIWAAHEVLVAELVAGA
jgi:hypothetical protein